MSSTQHRTDSHRALLRQVEEVVTHIARSGEEKIPIHAMADAIIRELRDELGIFGGRLYERSDEDYVLRATFPNAKPVDELIVVPRSYGPIELCLMQGLVYMEAEDPRLDRELEGSLGVEEFAAVEVGGERYLLGFNVAPGHDREDILFSLGVVRHAINQAIREQDVEAIFHQAKLIQNSILPTSAPQHGPFDIAGRSDSLDSVGGDLFDFIPIHDKILGLAIADASGHGFPAALQVRDVYMGLRMGMARDLKIVRTVERLNQIIHASTLTSRFVSMFYGELEASGLFIYVNAGHPAPFHLAATGDATTLREGGPILGPLKGATYDRGIVKMRPGDMLVLFTDGIPEALGRVEGTPDEVPAEEYGTARLLRVAQANQGKTAEQVIDAIFDDLHAWRGNEPARDDSTLMVVVYPEG
ncbi:MAG: SpoIIE family protein phosphatase [Acidobacteriota bacterium]